MSELALTRVSASTVPTAATTGLLAATAIGGSSLLASLDWVDLAKGELSSAIELSVRAVANVV